MTNQPPDLRPSARESSLPSPSESWGAPVAPPQPAVPHVAAQPQPTVHTQPVVPQPVAQPQSIVQSQNVNVNVTTQAPTILFAPTNTGPSFFIRAIWFLFIGWWLSGLGIVLGYLLMITILGIPVAFALFNRVPQMQTLRPRSTKWSIETVDGITRLSQVTIEQRPWWMRALYFLLVGWWLGAVWIVLAWALSLLILPLPLSLWMLDRISGVMTLQRH